MLKLILFLLAFRLYAAESFPETISEAIEAKNVLVFEAKDECTAKCQSSEISLMNVCKYRKANSTNRCRCDLDDDSKEITCLDVRDNSESCNIMCSSFYYKSQSFGSDLNNGKQMKRYCRYFDSDENIMICLCDESSSNGLCHDTSKIQLTWFLTFFLLVSVLVLLSIPIVIGIIVFLIRRKSYNLVQENETTNH